MTISQLNSPTSAANTNGASELLTLHSLNQHVKQMTYTATVHNFNVNVNSSVQDYADAIKLLKALHGNRDITFQTFDDGKKEKGYEDKSLCRVFTAPATISTMKRLEELNKRGAGIYHTVNNTDGTGRREHNITKVTALFTDYDKVDPKNLDQLPPISAKVQSKNGVHLYWLLEDGIDLAQFTPYQQMLINLTGGDEVVKDLPRVMRMPDFFHMKNPSDPFMTKLVELHPEKRYTLADFPTPDASPTTKTGRKRNTSKLAVGSTIEDLKQAVSTYFTTAQYSPMSIEREIAIWAHAQAKLEGASRIDGTATSALFNTGVYAATLFTRTKLSPEAVVDRLFQIAKQKYSHEDKGYEWDELAAKGHITRGLVYGINGRLQQITDTNYPITPTVVMNTQYVADMGIDLAISKITAIRAAIGTGKTIYARQAIQGFLANNPEPMVVIATHREQLVKEWTKELSGLGFTAYNDTVAITEWRAKQPDGLRKMLPPRLVTTYDSLDRLSGILPSGCLLVLDETDQALGYLRTCRETSIKSRRVLVHDTLKCLCQAASHIILASATLTDLDIDHVATLAGTDSVQTYVNTQLPYQKTVVQLPTEQEVRNSIEACIKDGLNAYVTCDSKAEAESTAKLFQDKYPDTAIVAVTADTKSGLALDDINAFVKQYQVVFASPTLGTGTDINCQHFHNVYGLFTNPKALTYQDCLQSVGRVRYPHGKVYVYIDDRYSGETLDSYIASFNLDATASDNFVMCRRLHMDSGLLEDVKHPDASIVLEFTTEYLRRQWEGRQNRGTGFWAAIKASGHVMEELAEETTGTVTAKQVKAVKDSQKQQKQVYIADAPTVTVEQVEDIKRRNKARKQVSELERASVERYYISKALYPSQNGQAKVTTDEVAWYQKTGKTTVRLYDLMAMEAADATVRDLEVTRSRQSDGGIDGKFYARDRGNLIRLITVLKTLVEAGKYTKDDLAEFMRELTAIGVDAVKQLGVTVNLSDASRTVASLLRLLEWTVERKRFRLVPPEPNSFLNIKTKVEGTELGYVFHLSRTPWQQDLVNRLTTTAKVD